MKAHSHLISLIAYLTLVILIDCRVDFIDADVLEQMRSARPTELAGEQRSGTKNGGQASRNALRLGFLGRGMARIGAVMGCKAELQRNTSRRDGASWYDLVWPECPPRVAVTWRNSSDPRIKKGPTPFGISPFRYSWCARLNSNQ